ncbi:MAG: hypothetical protein P794_09785 [Epsilonproteobacteria bacterium (ex Lamellibrachia satsuma)]|nr:MAG: hypothetical protein P794_09785 [Epsilonproteobacteria bacterium (ex Lamellibrachia satsuma)]
MKSLIILTIISQLLFSATPGQVERYLSISNAEEELLELESQFSIMQNNFQASDTNTSEEKETYDMQMLSIRFREYIQTNLSEDEMEEILQNYKNIILLQFISASSNSDSDPKEVDRYVKTLKEDPEAQVRMDLVEKISKELNHKESMVLMFDNLIKPLMQAAPGGKDLDANYMKKSRENYLKDMMEKANKETLFASKDFTMEELEELLKIAQTPAMDHEMKAVYGGMAYALKEFFLSLASKYDISKHQR